MKRADTTPDATWTSADRDDRTTPDDSSDHDASTTLSSASRAPAHDTEPSGAALGWRAQTSAADAIVEEAGSTAEDGAAVLAAELEHFAGRAPQYAKHQAESAGLGAAKYAARARPARSHLPVTADGGSIVLSITAPMPTAPSREPGGMPPDPVASPLLVGGAPPERSEDAATPHHGELEPPRAHDERVANRFVTTTPRRHLPPRRRRALLAAIVMAILAVAIGVGLVGLMRGGPAARRPDVDSPPTAASIPGASPGTTSSTSSPLAAPREPASASHASDPAGPRPSGEASGLASAVSISPSSAPVHAPSPAAVSPSSAATSRPRAPGVPATAPAPSAEPRPSSSHHPSPLPSPSQDHVRSI